MSDDTLSTATFTRRTGIVVGVVTAVVLGLLFIGAALQVLLLVLAGVLLAVFFRGLGGWLSRHTPLSEGWGVLVAVGLALVLLLGTGWWLAPRLSEQATQLGEQLPQSLAGARRQLGSYAWGRWLVRELPVDFSFQDALRSGDGSLVRRFLGWFGSALGVLGNIYVLLFVAIFVMAEPRPYQRGMVLLVPPAHRDRAREVLQQLGSTLFRWVLGKLFAMTVVTVLTALGLWALGMPLVLTLALLAGLFSFIPNFGPLIGLVPAALLALMQGPDQALLVVGLYALVQLLESNLITPLAQRKLVDMPPALVIIAQVLMGLFSGVLGLLLATPIVAMVLVLVKMLYIKDVLDDPKPEAQIGES